ncbi:hypothetical protein [Sphingomonas crusticola]|uniref:hypothetical protein n=1 Tax=Sphingomonas crusticola TaxID=1697973 RepID=UPI000E243458|nr:hypothetical protein [Sphingomonas crusticola]
MKHAAPFALLALLGAPLAARPAPAPASEPPTRIATLVIFGNDPCPRSTEDEVVVCARQPEGDRYRIPKQFRGRQYNAARDGSWAGTARVLEYISREGLPDSCSPIGSNGQTGCFRKFLEQNRR